MTTARVTSTGIAVVDDDDNIVTSSSEVVLIFTSDGDDWLREQGYRRTGDWIVRYSGHIPINSETTIEKMI